MLDMKDINIWIKGLVNAGISGGTVAISTMAIAPETFNFHEGLHKLLYAALASAIVSIAKYLSINPTPKDIPNGENPNDK